MLSPKVHNCYRLAGCANANVPYLPCHPSGHSDRGCTEKIRGVVDTEVQLLYARYAVLDGVYDSLEQALETFKSKQGLNKLAMQTWLTEININVEKLAIHSFVHLPLELAQRVWKLVLHKRCEGRYRAAITDKALELRRFVGLVSRLAILNPTTESIVLEYFSGRVHRP